MAVFETERLILRPFENADADAIFALRSDAAFMRFIKEPETRAESDAWLRMVSRYWKSDNIGFWAVVFKETGETIGWTGVWILPETYETEIGFSISHKHQGKGIATEAARVALEYGFENRNSTRVVALAMPENLASRRVMEKLGMRFERRKHYRSYDKELVYYALEKKDYARIGTPALSQANHG